MLKVCVPYFGWLVASKRDKRGAWKEGGERIENPYLSIFLKCGIGIGNCSPDLLTQLWPFGTLLLGSFCFVIANEKCRECVCRIVGGWIRFYGQELDDCVWQCRWKKGKKSSSQLQFLNWRAIVYLCSISFNVWLTWIGTVPRTTVFFSFGRQSLFYILLTRYLGQQATRWQSLMLRFSSVSLELDLTGHAQWLTSFILSLCSSAAIGSGLYFMWAAPPLANRISVPCSFYFFWEYRGQQPNGRVSQQASRISSIRWDFKGQVLKPHGIGASPLSNDPSRSLVKDKIDPNSDSTWWRRMEGEK